MNVRTVLRIVLALLTAFAARRLASAAELRTLSDLSGIGVRYRSFLGQVDEAEFARMVAEFLGPAEVKLGAVVVYGSLEDYAIAGPRQQDHCSYESWRALIDRGARKGAACPDVHEAIKIGASIAVRRVNRICRRTFTVIRGERSPLKMFVSGQKIEVLEASFSRPVGDRNAHRVSADLYVRIAGLVSSDLASAITTQIRDLTGAAYLGVRVRSDSWFVTDCGFPAIYAFESRPQAPTKEQFEAMKYAACFVSGSWPIRCFEGAGRP